MLKIKLYLLVFFALLMHEQMQAQKPTVFFQQINTSNGLSHNRVNCILQDKRGFIWIGTNDGLNRYDGQHFEIFRNIPSDTSSIGGNIITDILEDANEILWIASTDGGITKYNYRLPPPQQFKQYKHNDANKASIPINAINCLLLHKNKYLWLGTSGHGAFRFDTEKEIFEYTLPKGTSTFLDLCFDSTGMIWGGKQGGGYAIIDPVTLQQAIDERYTDLYAKLPHMAINTLLADGNDIWAGSWDKVLYRINSHNKSEVVFAPEKKEAAFTEDEILSLAKDKAGNIWIGGKNNGLQYFDKNNNSFYHYNYDAAKAGTIANNRINCLFIDNSNNLWAGTNRGISRSSPMLNQFEQIFLDPDSKTPATIYDFYRDESNVLWIGTSQGLYRQLPGQQIIKIPLQYDGEALQVSKFFKDTETGVFYIGTNYSLFTFNPGTKKISLLPNTANDKVMKKIIDSRIISITKDTVHDHPVLVVLPYGHYFTWYDLTEQKWYSRADSIKNIISAFDIKDHLIKKIVKVATGEWYLANGKQGLAYWKNPLTDKLVYFTNDPGNAGSITNNNVSDFIPDNKGNFWISTFGGGLNYYNAGNKSFFHITSSPNLSEGITTDHSGNVWGISNGMLYRYAIADKSVSTFELPDIEKTGGVKGNIFKDANGNLLLSGDGYFINLAAENIKSQHSIPQLYFTDFSIYSSSYSQLLQQKIITLSYRQNYFSFRFSAPYFLNTQGVKYFCMMQGQDKDWLQLDNRNYAAYSNLPGGTYTFKVKAVTADNKQQAENSIIIKIVPPVWKQGWFFMVCALVIAAIAYAVYRYRVNELLKRQDIRNKIAQDLHDSVGSTLSSISVYSQVARIYKQKNKEKELDEALDKITDTSAEMIMEMNDIVWAINPGNDEMEKILQRMESFARPLLNTKNISCSFNYDLSVTRLNLPMEARKNFYLIFKEAINNLLKYAECTHMEVLLKQQGSNIELNVKDNGKGFDIDNMKQLAAKSLSGNGLINMKRRAAELKGNCTIESTPGKGTTIHLIFPIP